MHSSLRLFSAHHNLFPFNVLRFMHNADNFEVINFSGKKLYDTDWHNLDPCHLHPCCEHGYKNNRVFHTKDTVIKAK